MVQLCNWATAHCVRFDEVTTPDSLDLSGRPANAASWQIGPDGPFGPDGNRVPSKIWCAVGLYHERTDAERALENPIEYMPFLDRAAEAWHVLLQPIAHHGECNHLDPNQPGPVVAPAETDPGGPLVVLTTAGFNLGPGLDLAKVIDFRRDVDRIKALAAKSRGNLLSQSFTPHVLGSDGITLTMWTDEKAMSEFAYRPGDHLVQLERYRAGHTADRSSFSRLRALASRGTWEGREPMELVGAGR